MLYAFLYQFADIHAIFNVFRYLTVRAGLATLTAMLISFMIGPYIIRYLKEKQTHGQPIREDGPESHLLTKKGTPTMGGVMILLALGVSTLLWADLNNPYIWIILWVTFGFGFLGFVDDYIKVIQQNYKGLSGKVKLISQTIIALSAALWIQYVAPDQMASHLAVPFVKDLLFDLGLGYMVFVILVMVGSSNAVNLTDGLDGLAIVPIMIVASCFVLISYLVGNSVFAHYLQIHAVPGAGELAIFCAGLVGASLGFLWYNAPPAKIFMGDTGSLAFGGSLGAISVITKHELVLAIIGGVFVMEALSVIIQVASFKLTGKRVFRMAPIHHHFEQKGWAEPTIVIRFWIIALIFAMCGMITLKIR